MKPLFALPAFALVCACTAPQPQENRASDPVDTSAVPNAPDATTSSTPALADYPTDLQWMLERAAFAEDPERPCLQREVERPAWVADPQVSRRLREVRSDSFWLGRWARENLADRLAFAEVGYDFTPEPGVALPANPPPLIYEIAVTGSAPISPPPLGDRAKDVPVVVRYDVPVSFTEFMARRERGHAMTRDWLPTSLGEGGSPGGAWAVRVTISDDDDPQVVADALSQCDALRRAYRLPVLIEVIEGKVRMTLD